MRKVTALLLFIISFNLSGQNLTIEPTIDPVFFTADVPITITYDVTGTFMHDWTEAWIWLWLPDQQNVDVTSNITPASSNTTATDPAKFTKSVINGRQVFQLTITLTTFTGKAKEDINQVGMLIKGNDWSDGQSNDYLTSVTNGFTLRLESPTTNFGIYSTVQTIPIIANTSEPATIDYYIDGVLTNTALSATLYETTHDIISDGLVHTLKIIASNGVATEEKSYSYTMNPTPVSATIPVGMKDGINYHANNTSTTLVIFAPNKQYIFAIGDFNNWSLDNNYLMQKDGDRFWITINDLTINQEYIFQYLIDGTILIADPYTDKVSDPWDDKYIDDITYSGLINYPVGKTEFRASVLQTGQQPYPWMNATFTPPAKENLTIYELLVRDFDDRHTYQAVIEKLDYLQSLGINALELMPTNEFEGNQSWGYNPNFYFAPDKYYGTKNDLKQLIDECHSRGIAVIIDLVLNHSYNSSPLARMYWNESGGRPTADNPWYNEFHNFENSGAHWGVDFNHESIYTQNLVDSINSYWVNEYKVDGFRFDFTKGFGNRFKSNSTDSWGSLYDASRVALLKRMSDKIWINNPATYVIFEHLSDNNEEKELANYGIMLWGNMNHDYRRVGKGNSASLSWIYHTSRGWNSPNLVGYMESHDEERVAWDILKSYDITQAMQRLKLNAAFFLTVPGPKMLWQFEEMGYDEELNNNRLGIKPTHWEYLDNSERKQLFDVYTSLINLRSKTSYINAQYFTWNTSTATKWININHPDVAITIVGNFDRSSTLANAHFTKNGTWNDYFSGETIDVTDFVNHEIILSEGEFKIYTSVPIDNYIVGNPANFIAGIETSFDNLIQLYPNPAHNYLKINEKLKWTQVKIMNIQGNNMGNHEIKNNRIDVSRIYPGLYIIELTDDYNNKVVSRFIKE